jgi:hypothetical protein
MRYIDLAFIVRAYIEFVISFVLSLVAARLIFLPLLYGLPRSLYLLGRRKVTVMAPMRFLAAGAFWIAVEMAIGYAAGTWFPDTVDLFEDPAVWAGQLAVIAMVLAMAVSRGPRSGLRSYFDRVAFRAHR